MDCNFDLKIASLEGLREAVGSSVTGGKTLRPLDTSLERENLKNLIQLLTRFYEAKPIPIKNSDDLAIALARKAKLLSSFVALILENETGTAFHQLKSSFVTNFIADLSDHRFANMVAETLTYSLFLARLECFKKGDAKRFDIDTADKLIPRNTRILRSLFDKFVEYGEQNQDIGITLETVIAQLANCDIAKIYAQIAGHTEEDPMIHFYEPFLKEYDPKERKDRGVYYTLKYIVKSVDNLLKTELGQPEGLGQSGVKVSDPATGTGTFLEETVDLV